MRKQQVADVGELTQCFPVGLGFDDQDMTLYSPFECLEDGILRQRLSILSTGWDGSKRRLFSLETGVPERDRAMYYYVPTYPVTEWFWTATSSIGCRTSATCSVS
jgi:hypothetical protein